MHLVTEIAIVAAAVFIILALLLIAGVQISRARKRKKLRAESRARIDAALRSTTLGMATPNEARFMHLHEYYGMQVPHPDNAPIVTKGWMQP